MSQEDRQVQTIFGHEDVQESYQGQMKSFQWNANDVLLNGYLRIKSILEGDWNKMEWLWILARNRFLRPPVISGCSNRNAKRALK